MNGMDRMMEGMDWTVGLVGLVWLLVIVALILAIAALIKFLRK
jgi:hypothetical protein